MMGVELTYWSGVPLDGAELWSSVEHGVKTGPFTRGTVAVWGWARDDSFLGLGVPATAASTTPAGESGGMRAKSAGRLLGAYAHGPVTAGPLYQRQIGAREDIAGGVEEDVGVGIRGQLSVVPAMVLKAGSPFNTMSSAGVCSRRARRRRAWRGFTLAAVQHVHGAAPGEIGATWRSGGKTNG
jgi:hypothetical protein